MRMPFKLNRQYFPRFVANWVPASNDPRPLLNGQLCGDQFSQAISVFRFGRTFKTTSRSRFPQTVEALRTAHYARPPVVLDVGASDGITSLDIIANVPFSKYHVTDLNMQVRYWQSPNGRCYFYDQNNQCVLIASDRFICYHPDPDAFFPFSSLAKRYFDRAPVGSNTMPTMDLVNPEVFATSKPVEVCSYDVFQPWHQERVDLVVVANMLNRRYFSDSRIQAAVQNIIHALNPSGRIAIIESRETERSNVFQLTQDGLIVEHEVDGGVEIRDHVMRAFRHARLAA